MLSDDAADIVFGELYRLRAAGALLREFDMYEACGEGFAEPTEYIRQMLPVTLARRRGERGLDLHLQLAGRASAADRLGAVYGGVGTRGSTYAACRFALAGRSRRSRAAGWHSLNSVCWDTSPASPAAGDRPVNSGENPNNPRISAAHPISLVGWQRLRLRQQSPMRFTPQFLDELRARLPVSEVVGRRVKLKKAGREWKGLSPFQQEKSPSFTVNDQKGFYHDFSSGKHGNIISIPDGDRRRRLSPRPSSGWRRWPAWRCRR